MGMNETRDNPISDTVLSAFRAGDDIPIDIRFVTPGGLAVYLAVLMGELEVGDMINAMRIERSANLRSLAN